MSPRVAGAALALLAAVMLVASVAGIPTGWWTGHPLRNGEAMHKKDIDVSLLSAVGCNTGGDGTCEPLEMTTGFDAVRYAELGFTGILVLACLLLAGVTLTASERRKRAGQIVVAAALVCAVVAGALIFMPKMKATGIELPLSVLGIGVYFGGIACALLGSIFAMQPTPKLELQPPRQSFAPALAAPPTARPVDVLALLQPDRPPPSPGGQLPGPAGFLAPPTLPAPLQFAAAEPPLVLPPTPLPGGAPPPFVARPGGPPPSTPPPPDARALTGGVARAVPEHSKSSSQMPAIPPDRSKSSSQLPAIPGDRSKGKANPPALPGADRPKSASVAPPSAEARAKAASVAPPSAEVHAKAASVAPPSAEVRAKAASVAPLDRPRSPSIAPPSAAPRTKAASVLPPGLDARPKSTSVAPIPSTVAGLMPARAKGATGLPPPRVGPMDADRNRPLALGARGPSVPPPGASKPPTIAAVVAPPPAGPIRPAMLPVRAATDPSEQLETIDHDAMTIARDGASPVSTERPAADASIGDTTDANVAVPDAGHGDERTDLAAEVLEPRDSASDIQTSMQRKLTPSELESQIETIDSTFPEIPSPPSANEIQELGEPPTVPAPSKIPVSTAPDSLPPPRKEEAAASGPTPACPQCEAPMAWVEEHLRFYCRSCRMYF